MLRRGVCKQKPAALPTKRDQKSDPFARRVFAGPGGEPGAKIPGEAPQQGGESGGGWRGWRLPRSLDVGLCSH